MELQERTGINRWNYQKRGYTRLLRGVYTPAMQLPDDPYAARRQLWLAKAHAAVKLYADKHPVLWGASALQAMGVALPVGAEDWDRVHIMLNSHTVRPHRVDVVSHLGRWGRPIWKTFDGLPVLHPVDHWLQMAGIPDDDMIQIGDGFLRRRSAQLTIEDMRRRLNELAGWRGAKQARRAMKLVRPGTDSIYESKTRLILIHAGLPEPAVNPAVWCIAADATYHVDLGYVKQKIGIEYDGKGHSDTYQQMEIDADRRRNLQDAGWFIINVTAKQLAHPASLIRSIQTALILRAPGD